MKKTDKMERYVAPQTDVSELIQSEFICTSINVGIDDLTGGGSGSGFGIDDLNNGYDL